MEQRPPRQRTLKSCLGLAASWFVAAVVVRQLSRLLGLYEEPLVWSMAFGLMVAMVCLLSELAGDRWRRWLHDSR